MAWRSRVMPSASISRIRAFCGIRSSDTINRRRLSGVSDAPGGGAGGEHHRDIRLHGALAGLEEGAGKGAAAESGQHEAVGAALAQRIDQHAVGAAIGVHDVDAGQRLSASHVEGRGAGVETGDVAVEQHLPVGVDVSQAAEVAAAEYPPGRHWSW
jgi:hypothetical protein